MDVARQIVNRHQTLRRNRKLKNVEVRGVRVRDNKIRDIRILLNFDWKKQVFLWLNWADASCSQNLQRQMKCFCKLTKVRAALG